MSPTLADFWLGILAASTVAFALVALLAVVAVVTAIRWLSRYSTVELSKTEAGGVEANLHVRGRTGEPPR